MALESKYVICTRGRNELDNGWHTSFLIGMINGEWWHTCDVTKAKRFTRKELADFIANSSYWVHSAVIFEFTDEYLDRIKDNEEIKTLYIWQTDNADF